MFVYCYITDPTLDLINLSYNSKVSIYSAWKIPFHNATKVHVLIKITDDITIVIIKDLPIIMI